MTCSAAAMCSAAWPRPFVIAAAGDTCVTGPSTSGGIQPQQLASKAYRLSQLPVQKNGAMSAISYRKAAEEEGEEVPAHMRKWKSHFLVAHALLLFLSSNTLPKFP